MYKVLLRFIVALIVVLVNLLVPKTPAIKAASADYVNLQSPFTVDPNQPGYALQPGSTIYQFDNGTTEVYGPDVVSQLKALDSKCSLVHLPSGKTLPSNHIYFCPSGCIVVPKTNGYDILKGKALILSVVNAKTTMTKPALSQSYLMNTSSAVTNNSGSILPLVIPYPNSYIAQANDWNGPTGMAQGLSITDFSVNYVVPQGPPSNSTQGQSFWNGLQSLTQGLIQPVLEWGTTGNSSWEACCLVYT